MAAFVIDTNVLVVANNRSEPLPNPTCVRNSIECLRQARETTVVLDDRRRIISEYMQNANSGGQPGVGDAFLNWLHQNWAVKERCECVEIREHGERGFEEFPEAPALAKFDRSDRKFVAVALKSANSPDIAIAADSDWDDHEEALTANGVRLSFICRKAKLKS